MNAFTRARRLSESPPSTTVMSEEDTAENAPLVHFTRFEEFSDLLKTILAVDVNEEPSPTDDRKERVTEYRLDNIVS